MKPHVYKQVATAHHAVTIPKLSNQVIAPCNLTPFIKKTVTGVLLLRT